MARELHMHHNRTRVSLVGCVDSFCLVAQCLHGEVRGGCLYGEVRGGCLYGEVGGHGDAGAWELVERR
jgi:hypothetical protein